MDFDNSKSRKWFTVFAWTVLLYNIPVILWGAYVRASFSGDGCGAHWPFCAGQVLPQHMAAPMMIEFTHRMMTSVDTILTIFLCIWAYRIFPKRHAIRTYATCSLIFLLGEAVLGAGLVLLRYVAHDQSTGRAIYLSAHLSNTLLLLGAYTVTAWLAQTNTKQIYWNNISRKFALSLVVTGVVSVSGAIAALGDTLFPSTSLTEGIKQDFLGNSGLLLRLRMFHPFTAILGAIYLLWLASKFLGFANKPSVRMASMLVVAIIAFQVLAGAVNLSLMAPTWMQLFHLFMADALWIGVVLMVMEISTLQTVQEASLVSVAA